MDKVPAQVCNKRVIESLIKAGAFDEMKHRRRALVAIHEAAVDQYVDIKRNEAIGQDSLFGGLDDDGDGGFGITVAVPDIDEWDKMTLLGHEREMLGLYVSDHPLLGLEHVLANGTDCTIGQLMLDEERAGRLARSPICGLVTSVQRKITKRGDAWAMVTARGPRRRDRRAAVPERLPAGQHATSPRTRSSRSRAGSSRSKDQPELHGQEVTVPDLTDGPGRPGGDQPAVDPVHRRRSSSSSRTCWRTHPGVTEVRLRLLTRDATKVMRLDDRLRVTPSPALFADLKQLLGPGCLTVTEAGHDLAAAGPASAAVRRSSIVVVVRRGRRDRRRRLGVALDAARSASSSEHAVAARRSRPARGEFSGTGWYVVVAPSPGLLTAACWLRCCARPARAADPGRRGRRARCWPRG